VTAGELPAEGPATVEGVKDVGKISDAHTGDVTRIVDAVNASVRKFPICQDSIGADTWPPDVVEGSNMLGVRLWRRKDTPGGVEVYGEFGIAYVRRLDPDVAMLLGLGDWSKPAVG
jgi:hypothetical protein